MIALSDEAQVHCIVETEELKVQLREEHRQKIDDRLSMFSVGDCAYAHPSYTRSRQRLVDAMLAADKAIDGFSALEFMLAGSLVRMKDDAMRRWQMATSGVEKVHFCTLHQVLVLLDPNRG